MVYTIRRLVSSMNEPCYLQLRDFGKALNSDVVKKCQARGTPIPWVKDHAGQLEDPEYVMLTLSERAVLKDLRLLAARRGNKILFDETYLRAQLRCSPRTRLLPKVARLLSLGFLEPATRTTPNVYPDGTPSAHFGFTSGTDGGQDGDLEATDFPANRHIPSHPDLEPGENDVRLEVEVEENNPPTPLSGKGGKRLTREEKKQAERLTTLRAYVARVWNEYSLAAIREELTGSYKLSAVDADRLIDEHAQSLEPDHEGVA